MTKLNFQQSLLQSLVSHVLQKSVLFAGVVLNKHLLLINIDNSCAIEFMWQLRNIRIL